MADTAPPPSRTRRGAVNTAVVANALVEKGGDLILQTLAGAKTRQSPPAGTGAEAFIRHVAKTWFGGSDGFKAATEDLWDWALLRIPSADRAPLLKTRPAARFAFRGPKNRPPADEYEALWERFNRSPTVSAMDLALYLKAELAKLDAQRQKYGPASVAKRAAIEAERKKADVERQLRDAALTSGHVEKCSAIVPPVEAKEPKSNAELATLVIEVVRLVGLDKITISDVQRAKLEEIAAELTQLNTAQNGAPYDPSKSAQIDWEQIPEWVKNQRDALGRRILAIDHYNKYFRHWHERGLLQSSSIKSRDLRFFNALFQWAGDQSPPVPMTDLMEMGQGGRPRKAAASNSKTDATNAERPGKTPKASVLRHRQAK